MSLKTKFRAFSHRTSLTKIKNQMTTTMKIILSAKKKKDYTEDNNKTLKETMASKKKPSGNFTNPLKAKSHLVM